MAVSGLTMTQRKVMQEPKRPRGRVMRLADAIADAIEKFNRKPENRGRVEIPQLLRALEWTRYRITEEVIERMAGSRTGE